MTTPTSPADLVVNRRAGLLLAVALGAAAVSAGWAWRYAVAGGTLPLLVAALLALLAVGYALAWRSARTPLLVADPTGLRLRLAGAWTGVPWTLVDRVQVTPRGRVSDGHVAVVSAHVDQLLAGGRRTTRFGAALNQRLYDAPLVVPFGLTTTVSTVDVADALERLSRGRSEIVDVGRDEAEPVATVELVSPRRRLRSVRLPSPAGATAGATVAESTAGGAVALPAMPARRAEVTMPLRPEHATLGGLALSFPDVAEELPEIQSLRWEPAADDADRPEASNVSLIIDATTDLSARAMQRVRRTALSGPLDRTGATAAPAVATGGGAALLDEPARATYIGGDVSSARSQLGLTVDDLAERTRIRPFVIESIERDDFSPCGGDFYARGHLRMLARVLGVDATPLVTAYDEHFATSPVNARDVFEVELASGTTGMVKGGDTGAGWGTLAAAVLVLLLVWGVARYLTDAPGSAAAPLTPVQNTAGLGSPGVGNPPVTAPRTAHVTLIGLAPGSRVRVVDRFHESVFAGQLAAGKARKISGEAPLRVWAKDGGAVRLSVRGRDLGRLGDAGQPARQRVDAPHSPSAHGGHHERRRGSATPGGGRRGTRTG